MLIVNVIAFLMKNNLYAYVFVYSLHGDINICASFLAYSKINSLKIRLLKLPESSVLDKLDNNYSKTINLIPSITLVAVENI